MTRSEGCCSNPANQSWYYSKPVRYAAFSLGTVGLILGTLALVGTLYPQSALGPLGGALGGTLGSGITIGVGGGFVIGGGILWYGSSRCSGDKQQAKWKRRTSSRKDESSDSDSTDGSRKHRQPSSSTFHGTGRGGHYGPTPKAPRRGETRTSNPGEKQGKEKAAWPPPSGYERHHSKGEKTPRSQSGHKGTGPSIRYVQGLLPPQETLDPSKIPNSGWDSNNVPQTYKSSSVGKGRKGKGKSRREI